MTAVATKQSCVRSFYVYKDVWAAVVGEGLVCRRERRNYHDIYTVLVTKDSVVVGHFARKILSLFLMKGGNDPVLSAGVHMSQNV